MKKFLGTTLLLLAVTYAFTQNKVQGIITEPDAKTPVAGAIVKLNGRQTIADDKGEFRFDRILAGSYEITVSSLGFKTYQQTVSIGSNANLLMISLTPISLFLQPLELKSVRASDRAPFAKTNIGKEEISRNNLGQDIPYLLDQTPSVVVNSDAGNGVGYTYLHIRGSDATRINVTLNGIPYNDAESMGTYFVDLPDFLSSVNSIQVQRGVGTSSNGAGAFGASLNLSTNEFIEKAGGEVNNSFGSFNTWKNTVKASSGLIDDHFTVDLRLSRISSDGYIDRATSNLQSFYFSTAYLNKNSSLRLNIFSGKEKTYQAWYGVPDYELATDRTYNPAGMEKPGSPYANQTDNYTQTHYQLFFNHSFNTKWSFNTASFLSRGKGYYEEYKASQAFADYGLPNYTQGTTTIDTTDLVRQRWLDNYFYGQIASLQYKDSKDELSFGGGITKYDGKHYGNITWLQYGSPPPGYRYYDYPATKTDGNFYTKWQHKLSTHWLSFIDLQYRHVYHDMNGFEGNPTLHITRSFDFVNPKAGITYTKNGLQAFLSYAIGNKEPNRDDFQASLAYQPKQETLQDLELGIEKKTNNWHYGVTAYYMYYHNQLVLTGQINDVGSYTRTNVPNSYRTGLEFQAGTVITKWMNIAANLTLSKNKISSFTEYIDNYDNGLQNPVAHTNTDISFSPSVIGGGSINFLPLPNLELGLISKYVSKQYMDNSQNEARKLNDYFVENLRIAYTLKGKFIQEWHLVGQVYNLFNRKYEPNGYTYEFINNNSLNTQNWYYPMAGTNFMLALNLVL